MDDAETARPDDTGEHGAVETETDAATSTAGSVPTPSPRAGEDLGVADRRSRLTSPIALVVLVAIAIGSLGFALTQRARVGELESTADRRTAITTVAGEFATALLTYDYRDLEVSSAAIRALSTPSFADEYSTAFNSGLGAEILELEATATSTVHDVFISDSDLDTARVIVVADSEIVSAAGNRAALGTYLDVQLIRLDGAWRVDDVTTVANTDQSGVPAPEAADQPISPTTVPSATTTPADASPSSIEATPEG